MQLEMIVNNRNAHVELVGRDNSIYVFHIDGKEVAVDVVPVGQGNYSIIYQGKSYEFEIVKGAEKKKYSVSHRCFTFDVEVMDAESKYLKSRSQGLKSPSGKTISSPMPGKVVRIPVSEGEHVQADQTLIVISAMKMDSEYKAGIEGVIKKIHVKEGEVVEGKKVLIELE